MQHTSTSCSPSAAHDPHHSISNGHQAPNQSMWAGDTSAPINNTTFAFPVPRPGLAYTATTSAIPHPSHPNMIQGHNPAMVPHPMNAQGPHPMSSQAPHPMNPQVLPARNPSLQMNEGLARHVSVRRQGTISRPPLDSREMSMAREQVARRSLGDSDEPLNTPSDPLGPLPPGWYARTAPDGRIYFSDSKGIPNLFSVTH
jgi:hypothetical protein